MARAKTVIPTDPVTSSTIENTVAVAKDLVSSLRFTVHLRLSLCERKQLLAVLRRGSRLKAWNRQEQTAGREEEAGVDRVERAQGDPADHRAQRSADGHLVVQLFPVYTQPSDAHLDRGEAELA